jgi:hypothetical protein
MVVEDEAFPEGSTRRALRIGSGVGRTPGVSPKQLVWEPKNGGAVRNYPLITKELLTDEVNLYLLMQKHIQDILAVQYV